MDEKEAEARPVMGTIFLVSGIHRRHMLANLSVLKLHPNHSCIGKPIQVYYEDVFEDDGVYSLIPVQFIQN